MEFSAALNLHCRDEVSFPGARGEDNEGSSGSGGANLSCSSGRCSSVENIWICVGLMGNTDVQSEELQLHNFHTRTKTLIRFSFSFAFVISRNQFCLIGGRLYFMSWKNLNCGIKYQFDVTFSERETLGSSETSGRFTKDDSRASGHLSCRLTSQKIKTKHQHILLLVKHQHQSEAIINVVRSFKC